MDPVTHVASGILVGQALRDRYPRTWWFVVYTAFCAWIPDIDIVLGNLGPEAAMRYHRGLTHSIVGGLIMAPLLAVAFRPLLRGAAYVRLAVLAFGCLMLHDFLDVVTTYGTQIFQPFSDARIGFPAIFIVDPLYTGVMLVAVILGFLPRTRTKTVALAALAWIVLYPAASLGLREIVVAAQERRLAAEGPPGAVAHVTTDGLSPIFWKVVVDDGENYRVRGASLLDPAGGPDLVTRRKADREEMRRLGRDAPIVATYEWFVEFPVVSEFGASTGAALPGGTPDTGLVSAAQAAQPAAVDASPRSLVLLYSDLRFLGTSPVLPEARRDPNRLMFAMQVELDASGRPRAVQAFRGGGAVLVHAAPAAAP